jgi:hypothetical protein
VSELRASLASLFGVPKCLVGVPKGSAGKVFAGRFPAVVLADGRAAAVLQKSWSKC